MDEPSSLARQPQLHLLSRDDWGLEGGEPDTPGHPSITIDHDVVSGPLDTGGLADGVSAEDVSPGPFKQDGPCYVILGQSEPLPEFLRELAHSWEFAIDPNVRRRGRTFQDAQHALIQLNPFLKGDAPAGRKIILPSDWSGAL